MATHRLLYWKPANAARNREWGGQHFASEQLSPNRVAEGDVVWVATCEDGSLYLLGRMVVGRIIEGQKAAEAHFHDTDLWPARYHIAAEPGTEEPMQPIDITGQAGDLRFVSRGAPRLDMLDGRVDPKQLQAMRKLTDESGEMLRSAWEARAGEGSAEGDEENEDGEIIGGGFGSPEQRREVEQAAVACVTRRYQARGWQVESVEDQKVGYDLLCRTGRQLAHVEVKGVQGTELAFNITAGEVACARHDGFWTLCVVCSALSERPRLRRFAREEFLSRFKLSPLSYRAEARDG
ncbi:MAG: DUF3883 domain-containing protein [Armatimonadetes bacterium]|nr:DUF3883 domain-containing protein [Armatimonadota bacterium]